MTASSSLSIMSHSEVSEDFFEDQDYYFRGAGPQETPFSIPIGTTLKMTLPEESSDCFSRSSRSVRTVKHDNCQSSSKTKTLNSSKNDVGMALYLEWQRKRKLMSGLSSKETFGFVPKFNSSVGPSSPVRSPVRSSRFGAFSPCSSPSSTRSTSSTDSSRCNDAERFQSILDRPFSPWYKINQTFQAQFPHWSRHQRNRMIHHSIHFLELKAALDEDDIEGFLMPSIVLDQAWRALISDSALYQTITQAIQDFHELPREPIYYTVTSTTYRNTQAARDLLRKTETLFKVYFNESLPMTIEDEEKPKFSPLSETRRVLSTTLAPWKSSTTIKNQKRRTRGRVKANGKAAFKPVFEFCPKLLAERELFRTLKPLLKKKTQGDQSLDDTEEETQSISSISVVDSLMGLDLI